MLSAVGRYLGLTSDDETPAQPRWVTAALLAIPLLVITVSTFAGLTTLQTLLAAVVAGLFGGVAVFLLIRRSSGS